MRKHHSALACSHKTFDAKTKKEAFISIRDLTKKDFVLQYKQGLIERSWSTERRGDSPAKLLYWQMQEKTLSIFIDESGDFGKYDKHCPNYLVTMVFHNQHISIEDSVQNFNQYLKESKYPEHAVHAGPLIRREKIYEDWERKDRKALFNALFNFSRKIDFQYICVGIEKRLTTDKFQLISEQSRKIAYEIQKRTEYLTSFNKVNIYYDNGQAEQTGIITSVFSVLLTNVEFRRVQPDDYKLFQIADMICTLKLIELKAKIGKLSKSEHDFFVSKRELQKNYLKKLKDKEL